MVDESSNRLNFNYGKRKSRGMVVERNITTVPPYTQGDHLVTASSKIYEVVGVPITVPVNLHPVIAFRFNMGEREYLNTWNSYLSFKFYPFSYAIKQLADNLFVRVKKIDRLIKDIVLIDKRGIELERIDSRNRLFDAIGSSLTNDLYQDSIDQAGNLVEHYVSSWDIIENKRYSPPQENRDCKIPLSSLCGLFKCTRLLPPQLMDGLELRITLDEPSAVIQEHFQSSLPLLEAKNSANLYNATGGADPELITQLTPYYIVDNLSLVLETSIMEYEVCESVEREYNSESGLIIDFVSYGREPVQVIQQTIGNDPNLLSVDGSFDIIQSYTDAKKIILLGHIEYMSTLETSPVDILYDQFISRYGSTEFIPGTSFQLSRNGILYPKSPMDDTSITAVLFNASFGKYSIPSLLASILVTADSVANQFAPLALFDVTKSSLDISKSATTYSLGNTPESRGVRIDGTIPHTVLVKIPPQPLEGLATTTDSLLENYGLETINQPEIDDLRFRRVIEIWVEHKVIVVLKSSGTHILK